MAACTAKQHHTGGLSIRTLKFSKKIWFIQNKIPIFALRFKNNQQNIQSWPECVKLPEKQ
jgi:hypothetical protein